jgi:cGMP-dependent protein kinase
MATGDNAFFKSQTDVTHKQCCKALQLQHLNTDDVLFEQGDPGDSFYIIHTGSVYVVVNGAQVAQLDAGATFGELSLMRHEPRAATIIASADTDLMYLVSTDYDRILRADQTLQAERKLKFLIKLPVFRDFDE